MCGYAQVQACAHTCACAGNMPYARRLQQQHQVPWHRPSGRPCQPSQFPISCSPCPAPQGTNQWRLCAMSFGANGLYHFIQVHPSNGKPHWYPRHLHAGCTWLHHTHSGARTKLPALAATSAPTCRTEQAWAGGVKKAHAYSAKAHGWSAGQRRTCPPQHMRVHDS